MKRGTSNRGGVMKVCLGVFLGIMAVLIFVFIVLPVLGVGGLLWVASKAPKDEAPGGAIESPVTPFPTTAAAPLAPAPVASREAQARAVTAFPQLSQPSSPLNAAFLKRYNQYRSDRPSYFTNPEWPVALAAEAAASLGIPRATPFPRTPAPETLTGPVVRLLGHVTEVTKGGLLVDSFERRAVVSALGSVGGGAAQPEYASDRGRPEILEGTFFIVGHPAAKSKVDQDAVDVDVQQSGIFRYTAVDGSQRTIKKFKVIKTVE